MHAAPASRPGAVTVEWRAPAVRYAVDRLGLPDDRLIRVVDVRTVRPDEAWVALVVDGRHVVVGLRREACGGGVAADGWFRLLYIDAGDGVIRPGAGTDGQHRSADRSAAGTEGPLRG